MIKNILSLKKPIWFMRQAGRHLPEYLKIRKNFKSFLDFCFNYESIIESTLQPIKRYDLDCAIVFSDILVIPYILNQNPQIVPSIILKKLLRKRILRNYSIMM